MFTFLAKIGFKSLLEKCLKQALLLVINELYSYKDELKEILINDLDSLSAKTKEKLLDEVNKL